MAARARWRILALPLALLLAVGSSPGLVRQASSSAAAKPPVPKAISVSYTKKFLLFQRPIGRFVLVAERF